jgi:Glycosyl transferase family 2/Methyltransferase domain
VTPGGPPYTRSVKVVGLYLVRNEVDVIETNLRHHFANVIDEAIVVDNGSIDGTLELLGDLAEDMPLQVASEVGQIYQGDRVTRMARFATQQGADWVLPIDADEFWVGTDGPFRTVLEETAPEVRALFVDMVNFVQSRDVLVARPGVLSTMTMRPESTVGSAEEASRLVRDGEAGWLEITYTPKVVHRAVPGIVVAQGNHLTGIGGGVPTDRLAWLHAPIRARSVLMQKMDHGRRSLEERGPADSSWHLKRWWQMARDGTVDREWEALSYGDDAITVGATRHGLVLDDRLRRVVEAVAPQVRTTVAQATNAVDEMPPAVGAAFLALDTVPGSLAPLDFRVLVELDRLQKAHDIGGDLFEIGTAFGRSAILLGHLARPPDERLTVCDVFENAWAVDAESFPLYNHWYSELTEKAFLEQYERFHELPPDIVVGPSEQLDAGELAGTCRFVHVDGGHRYDIVRQDVATAHTLLGPGGIVAFGDIATPDSPGVALAVWELVLSGSFVPLCITEGKLYGTWDGAALDWVAGIDDWAERAPDLGTDIHTLAGWPVRRIFTLRRPPMNQSHVVRIPDLEDMPGAGDAARS